MIDLSFLTEEEQEIIQEVLKRDAELKKAEEQRIQNLQKTVSDRGLLRHMTGEWFYETKQLRHQDRIHGTDIIRASMKQAPRPPATLGLTQGLSEKLPVLSSENEDVCVPPVARGSLQVAPGQRNNESSFTAIGPKRVPWGLVGDAPKAAVQSPPKQRKNPFNGEAEGKNSHLLNGRVEGPFASYEGYTPAVDLRADLLGSTNMHNAFVPPPLAENTAVSISRQDCPAEVDRPGGGANNTHLPTPSSTDLPAHLEPQNPVVPVSPTETWKDRKQVSSSSAEAPTRVAGWRDGEEVGDDRMLDMDRVAPTEAATGDLENAVTLDPERAVDKELDGKHQELPEQEVTRHQLLDELFRVSSTQEDSGSTVHSETEEVRRCQDGEAAAGPPGCKVPGLPEQSPGVGAAAKQPCERSKNTRLFRVSGGSEQKSLGRFRDENDGTEEAEKAGSLSRGAASAGGDEAAAWGEAGTLQPTLLKERATSADGAASASSETKTTLRKTSDAAPGQNDLPQKDCGLDFPGEDGVYRAKPIVIYETDDSLTESQPQDDIFASVASPQGFHHPSEEGNHPAPLPLPAVDSTTVEVSKQRDEERVKHGTPWVDSREMPEGEGQTSPRETSHSGSRSPERSPLRTFARAGELRSPDHHRQVKERPPSPGRSSSPKLKRQKEEVRRSPSKTCHPRVLPRESTSPQTSRLQGSPLKTFPINIEPQTPEEHQGRPTPMPRQRSPSNQANQAAAVDTRNISEVPSSAALQPMKVSAESLPSLARSCVPQDYQHYLGPHEKAFVPSFYQEKPTFAVSSNPTEALPSGVQVPPGNLNQDHQEASGPVMSPLQRMSSSKSVEDLISPSGEERIRDHPKEHMNQHVDEGQQATLPSERTRPFESSGHLFSIQLNLSDPQPIKTSLSVPVLQLEETDSDSTFEPNRNRRNTSSSVSNFSLSSGMNSMSSISSSISSIFPADAGDLEVQGSLQFAVNYIQKLGEFHVFVVNCSDLAVADAKKKRSDPYVKCYLLPDKSKLGKRKTTVKKKTSHPTFNEILRFKIPLEVLKTQNLNMSVWHNDTFGRNSFLGEVDVDLSEWDFGNTQINEYALQARASAQPSPPPDQRSVDNRGQMRVAVRFLPQTSHSKPTSRMETGEVQIWVKDCKNLPPVRGVTIDPFVKCTVLPDTSRKSRQKTRVVKRTASPMFNHTMVYDGFRTEDLREACVEITVWDHDRLHHHFIGGLRLGLGTGKSYGVDVAWMDSTSDEADLWRRMLQSDGEWVEDILPLRMLMMAKCK